MRISEEEYQQFLESKRHQTPAWLKKQLKKQLKKESQAATTALTLTESKPRPKPARSAVMNKTEARFEAEILMSMQRDGTALAWKWEGITLKLTNGVRYTPDFAVWDFAGKLGFIEVKGPRIWDDARVKFLLAREMFGAWHEFHCYQYMNKTWTEIWKGE